MTKSCPYSGASYLYGWNLCNPAFLGVGPGHVISLYRQMALHMGFTPTRGRPPRMGEPVGCPVGCL